MTLVINSNLNIRGRSEEQKKPLDYSYGPWNSMETALWFLHNIPQNVDKTYYGLTIGIKVFDEEDPTKMVGIDEYWWQPKCIWNESKNRYEDGFVRKIPANVPTVEKDDENGKFLGLEDGEHNYNTEWREGFGGVYWGTLGGDSSYIVDSENP